VNLDQSAVAGSVAKRPERDLDGWKPLVTALSRNVLPWSEITQRQQPPLLEGRAARLGRYDADLRSPSFSTDQGCRVTGGWGL